jgi:hypothetical protein
MISDKQLAANRLNAQRSTGPRSAEGKTATRFNALKHGMDAASTVIPGEDPAELEALIASYHDQFQPANPAEAYFVDTLAQSDWNKRRLLRIQAQLFRALIPEGEAPVDLAAAWQKDAVSGNALQKVFRQIAAIERSYLRGLAELRRLKEERQSQPEEQEVQAEPETNSEPVPLEPSSAQKWLCSEDPAIAVPPPSSHATVTIIR